MDFIQDCKNVIPANPDISGAGVRAAIYIQNLLSFFPAFYALLDGKISVKELETVEKQSTTILITAFAVLISAIFQAATIGLSSFHTSIILNLSWMNNTNTFIYFLLYIHHKSDPDRNEERVEPRWSAWRDHILRSLRPATSRKSDAESSSPVSQALQSQALKSVDVQDTETSSGWFGIYERIFRRNVVLFLGSLHLTVMAALGLWLWSSPSQYEWSQAIRNQQESIPLRCTSTTVFGADIALMSSGLRVVSLIVYSVFLVPALNLLFPALVFMMPFIRYGYSASSSSHVNDSILVGKQRPSACPDTAPADSANSGRTMMAIKAAKVLQATWPILFGLIFLLGVNLVFIADIEINLHQAKPFQESGESQWTFGQILALLLLALPIRDVYDYIRECVKADHAQKCTMRLKDSLNRDNPDLDKALQAAKHADDVRVHINDDFPSALQVAAFHGNLDLARVLLERKANINVDGGVYGTPLLTSALRAHSRVALFLIEHWTESATVRTSDRNGMTALHHAATHGLTTLVSCLLRHGADAKSLTNSGQTPLLAAAAAAVTHDSDACEWGDVIKQLLNASADINHSDNKNCTALIYAACNGHESILQLLLEQGAYVDQAEESADRDGWTALIHASENGFEPIVRLLIYHGGDVNKSGRNGETPVICAARNGHKGIMRTLLDQGADIAHLTENNETPLLYAERCGYEHLARVLLERGAEVPRPTGKNETSMVHAACNGYKATILWLLENGADANEINSSCKTPLISATENNHEPIVRLLLEHHANVDQAESNGWTPLIWAAYKGDKPIVRLLLEHGADVNQAESNSKTPLIWAACMGHEPIVRLLLEHSANLHQAENNGKTPLIWAAYKGHEPIVRLLLEHSADVNKALSNGKTPLIYAAYKGHEPIVRLLLEHGAEVNKAERDGKTPLIQASSSGRTEVMNILLDYGADLEHASHNGQTALHHAVREREEAAVQLLLERGADFTKVDDDGRTALSIARKKGSRAIVGRLEQAAAQQESRGETELMSDPAHAHADEDGENTSGTPSQSE